MGVGMIQIKNLSRGSRCYFPVFVDGANLSVGDLHFSQGDVRTVSSHPPTHNAVNHSHSRRSTGRAVVLWCYRDGAS